MAIPIRTVPTLTGKQAKSFLELARRNETEKAGTLDFSEQFSMVRRILSKSNEPLHTRIMFYDLIEIKEQ
jgi:uncharacterized protein (UPF0147 family)